MIRSFSYKHLVIALAIGLLAGAAFAVLVPIGTQTFDECVLNEMRGQPMKMLRHAYPICEKRFPNNN